MKPRHWFCLALLMAALAIQARSVRAENEGQADLDKATEAKLTARTMDDLAEVISLCDKAIDAGLDEANMEFANKILAGTLVQRAELIASAIFDRGQPPPQWQQLRQLAQADLDRALAIDGKQSDAQFLAARLLALPGGDLDKSREAINQAIELIEDDPQMKARALIMRAELSQDREQQAADLDEAVKIAPKIADTHRARGMFRMLQAQLDDALADFEAALQVDPKNSDVYENKGVILFLQKKYDEAKDAFDEAIKLEPRNASAYTHRARVLAIKKDRVGAFSNLEMALKIDPKNTGALLVRARLYMEARKNREALAEVENALRVAPGLIEGLQLHAALSAEAGRFAEAIRDLEQLRKVAPNNIEILMQLGMLYTVAKKPDKAIDNYNRVLAQDSAAWLALRGRADALLNQGKQSEAVVDYETALKIKADDPSILNNLAWVLATSPNDQLRNGKRAVELAESACKVTEFKQAHILSTLAASYAESGDFEKAVEWSAKAVTLGKGAVKNQLSKELESYKEHKPWREAIASDALLTDDSETDAASEPDADSAESNP